MNKLITTILLCFIVFISKAQTNVNAYNVNDSIWEKINSPYYITGQITIPAGKTLKIEPGVKVIFKGNYSITVNGYINCKGTATNKIEFKGDSLAPNVNVLWGSLIINTTLINSGIYFFKIEYCTFKNSNGLSINQTNPVISTLKNCEFYNNELCYKGASLMDSVILCKFNNNNNVFISKSTGLSLYTTSVTNNNYFCRSSEYLNKINNCKIENNGLDRFYVEDISNTQIINCIVGNRSNSALISIGTADNCVFDNNSNLSSYELRVGSKLSNSLIKGLRKGAVTNASAGAPVEITKNTFIDNLYGVTLNSVNSNSNSVTCNKFIKNKMALIFSVAQMDYVKNNTFCDNELDAVNTSSQSQNLTQNYFCSSNIESKIVDKNDSSKLGGINYNIYNSTQQAVIKVVSKDKSILLSSDTMDAIDTACLSKVNYLFIDLNTNDTICVKTNSVYIAINPSIMNNLNLPQILAKTYGVNGPVNTLVVGRYDEIYTITAPNGDKIQKVRVVFVKYECVLSLRIILNTPDTICHKIRTPYNSVAPSVQSDVFPSNQISLTKTSSNVNPNILGFYKETYEAVDPNNQKVLKTRYVIVKNDCDSNSSAISKITSKNNVIKLYPNPANTAITLEVLNSLETAFKLIDAQGKEVWNSLASKETMRTINVENLSNGIYFLIAKNDSAIYSEKIVIQH